MQNITLRKARKEDCPQLLELIKELAVYEKAPDEVTIQLKDMEEAGFGENPVWWAFVAEKNAQIIGMSLFYIRYSTWKGCRLYLEDIVVNEALRGQGVGKLLFDETVREAKRRNLSGMVWQVLDWNEPAINFYKKYKADFDSGWLNVSLSEKQLATFGKH